MKLKVTLIFSLLITLIFSSCDEKNPNFQENSVPTAEYKEETKFIKQWMDLLYFHIKHEIIGPPVAGRIYAYTGVGIYESLVWGMPEHQSMAGQLNGLDDLPKPNPKLVYDWPTVMVQCTYLLGDKMLEQFLSGLDKTVIKLYNNHIEERSGAVDPEVIENSKAFGKELANALIAWSEEDGYDDTRFKVYKTPNRLERKDYWEQTDFNQKALEPFWGTIRPMVLDNTDDCTLEVLHQYNEQTESDFYKQAVDVIEADDNLTEEQRNIALYWADCPGETATPGGHWTFIMNYFIRDYNKNLAEAGLMYGLTGLGFSDAFIQCWDTKYDLNLVRPKTFIRENFEGYENWEPYVTTPPFPEYASGHSVVSACLASILTHLEGDGKEFIDSTHVRIGLAPRTFKGFRDASNEAAVSRLYGGMHYPMAIYEGIEQGECVANKILSKVKLEVN